MKLPKIPVCQDGIMRRLILVCVVAHLLIGLGSASKLYAAERLGPRIPRQVERPNRGQLYPSGVGAEPRVPADAQDSTENNGAVSSVVDPSQVHANAIKGSREGCG
jgi:hypothetical protein